MPQSMFSFSSQAYSTNHFSPNHCFYNFTCINFLHNPKTNIIFIFYSFSLTEMISLFFFLFFSAFETWSWAELYCSIFETIPAINIARFILWNCSQLDHFLLKLTNLNPVKAQRLIYSTSKILMTAAENNWRTNSNNLSKTHHWSNPTRYFSLFKIIESLWVCFSPFDFLMSMLLVLVLSFYPSILHSSLLCGLGLVAWQNEIQLHHTHQVNCVTFDGKVPIPLCTIACTGTFGIWVDLKVRCFFFGTLWITNQIPSKYLGFPVWVLWMSSGESK